MNLGFKILSGEQEEALSKLTEGLTRDQALWLSGYLSGRLAEMNGRELTDLPRKAEAERELTGPRLTVLYGTETGHSENLAKKMGEKARFNGFNARVLSLYDFEPAALSEEENVAVIVSTHGEGDPPDMALELYNYLHSPEAMGLQHLRYSVLALGDKTYRHFCKAGEDIDRAFDALGAVRVTNLVKCDVDFEQDADIWMNNFILNLKSLSQRGVEPVSDDSAREELPISPMAYSESHPFQAKVLAKKRIGGVDGEKEIWHLELSLEGSGLEYEPGDALGIFPQNPETLVQEILNYTGFDPEQKVTVAGEDVSLLEALRTKLEITTVHYDLLERYLEYSGNQDLASLLEDEEQIDSYLFGHDVLDLLADFPYEWKPQKLVGILRPLPARLYSVASSSKVVGDAVHLTVALVRYRRNERLRLGACSGFLVDAVEEGGTLPVFVKKNPAFKLPDSDVPIIMIAAGTGIAPFRGFLQQLCADERKCDTWLFFGNRNRDKDFLYGDEWQEYLQSGVLNRLELAFSRDQEERIYVQHRLLECAADVYKWIEKGAVLYLCGSLTRLAPEVNRALLQIVQEQGGMSEEQAREFLRTMKREKRFQYDVY